MKKLGNSYRALKVVSKENKERCLTGKGNHLGWFSSSKKWCYVVECVVYNILKDSNAFKMEKKHTQIIVSHPGKAKSSARMLWEPKTMKITWVLESVKTLKRLSQVGEFDSTLSECSCSTIRLLNRLIYWLNITVTVKWWVAKLWNVLIIGELCYTY